MEITRIIGIGIIGAVLSVTVRGYRAELGICVALSTCALIIAVSLPQIQSVLEGIYSICENSEINTAYFKAILKIIGIAYITQFAAETAKDAGEGAIAKKLEFAGKIAVLAVMMPIVKSLLELITNTLAGF